MSWQGVQTAYQQLNPHLDRTAMDLEFHLEASKAKQVGKTITDSKRELILHVGLISKVIPLKVFLGQVWFLKTRYSLEIANPVTRILLTWTRIFFLHESIHPTRVVPTQK